MKKFLAILVLLLASIIGLHTNGAKAAEGGYGFYLLGSTTTNAGILPPPGTYLLDYNYFYSGSTDFALDVAGLILDGGVEGDVYGNISAPLWVAPGKVLGGHIGFLMLIPILHKDVDAGASPPLTYVTVKFVTEIGAPRGLQSK